MAFLLSIFALLGLCTGSFLNVCIDRLPQGQSIIYPPSHCSACNHRLSIIDLIPLFSYLWLRGRCRYCRAPIPLRIPFVEGITGLLFALLYWKFGLRLELGISIIYISWLIVIFVIDMENQLILDKVVYPGMVIAFAFSFFWPGLRALSLPGGEAVGRMASSLAGGALGMTAIALPFIIYPTGMGMGDIKLGAMVGLMTGYPLVILALLLSVISGGLIASILLIFKIKKRSDAIPFGPFLATAAMVTALWGQAIWQWYL
ncbi:MAG: prepilin peptidase [Dehalococcoidales bacterium]|nr:prepilin peptidase [Dehalococcoidales bacterium]